MHEFEQGSLHNKSLQRSDAEDCSTILVVSRSSSVTSLTHRRPQTAPIDHITVELFEVHLFLFLLFVLNKCHF